jgi:hypothetical protein
MKCWILIFVLLSLLSYPAEAQKVIHTGDKRKELFNLSHRHKKRLCKIRGADMAIIVGNTSYPVIRTGFYDYLINEDLDSIITVDTSKTITFSLKTREYEYRAGVPRVKYYLTCKKIRLEFFKAQKDSFMPLPDFILECDHAGYNADAQIIRLK